jgi:pSer/pThr/pTyr-binding forkhead associated (FHA) protein
MRAPLVKYSGGALVQQFVLEHSTSTIGRQMGNLIQILDAGISKQHAVIRDEGDVRVIEDAGSKNGVFVNGSRAKKPVKLRNGDKVGFGPSEFVFETAWTADDWDGMHVIDLSKKSSDGTDSEGPGKRRWQAEVVRSWTVSDAIAGEWWNWQTRKI